MSVTCPACGAEVPAGRVCEKCLAALPTHAARDADPRVADFAIRASARVVDFGLGFFVGGAAVVVATIALTSSGAPQDLEAWAKGMQHFGAQGYAASVLGSSLYFALAEWIGAATVGKLLFGLRVTSEGFDRVPLSGALVRSFVALLDGFLFGMLAYVSMSRSPLRQRLGDRWGGTAVVRRAALPSAARGTGRVALGITAGLGVWIALEAYSLYQRALAAGAGSAVL